MKKYKLLTTARSTLTISASLIFVCSGLLFAFSPNVSAYTDVAALTDAERTLCVDTNGQPQYTGSELNCVCPPDTIWTSDKGCRTKSQLCSDTDGVWGYNGSQLSCTCPSGTLLISSRCQSDIDPIGSGTSTSSSSGANPSTAPATNTQPIETDCEPKPPGTPLSSENCGIIKLLVIGINALSAIAGIVIVASLMIAGFQYMTAQDNAGQIQKAKSRIIMTILALALFIFMYAFLNYLVPGGVI